jgi:hypothetical protein
VRADPQGNHGRDCDAQSSSHTGIVALRPKDRTAPTR